MEHVWYVLVAMTSGSSPEPSTSGGSDAAYLVGVVAQVA
jgi:hypothetical protein